MPENRNITTPAYRKIAIDIAKNITNGVYVEKQKLYGRSALASQYGVSSETIRKAVCILKDVGVVTVERGSGIEITSIEKAKDFIKQCNESKKISEIKDEIMQWSVRQSKEVSDIADKIKFIIGTTERVKSNAPFIPYEIPITKTSPVLGKTAGEIFFWQNTGATIIAIKREDILIISPGPYATFFENDIFFIIGDDDSYSAAIKLLSE